jgi:hypothetical protein
VLQVHFPPEHGRSLGQGGLQPDVETHVPPTHDWPVPQAVVQLPQWDGFVLGSTHFLPHLTRGFLHFFFFPCAEGAEPRMPAMPSAASACPKRRRLRSEVRR